MTPPAKTDVPQERDAKEKEPSRKPVASLILTVKLALMADPRLFQYEIEAGEDQQTITLSGRVSSEEEKTAASDVARTVTGVKAVINKLDVSKDLSQALTKKRDEVITHLIKDQFAKSATLKAANFEVKTEEGIVSLSGAVRFQVIALEAAEAARQVPGVRAVKTDKVRLEGEG
jgi:hyperosmotically inducible protein